MPEKFVLRQWHIYFMVLLGTLFRLVFGIQTEAWKGSPDQLAWGLALEEGMKNGFHYYRQLIHYPHEGGSFLISLMALFLRPFSDLLPPLSIAALLTDTLSRYIQIKLSCRLFGPATAAWFAVWTVLGVPLLLPWATVNFGLHSLASFLPFIFMHAALTYNAGRLQPALAGIVSGLSISFSYDCVIFIPAYLCWVIAGNGQKKLLYAAKFLLACLLAMIPHILLRTIPDMGYKFEQLSLLSLHKVALADIFSVQHLKNIFMVWYGALPVSFSLNAAELFSAFATRLLVFAFCIGGLVLAAVKNGVNKRTVSPGLLLILFFMLAYALSPFYAESLTIGSYVYFRHFAFIIPLIVALMLNGFVKAGKAQLYLAGTWIVICGIFSLAYFRNAEPTTPAYRAAGWVLARKYGEPELLLRLREVAPPEFQNELMSGFGWGLSTAIFDGKNEKDKEAVKQLFLMYKKVPDPFKELFQEGVHFSFREGITPVLDPNLLPLIDSCINANKLRP